MRTTAERHAIQHFKLKQGAAMTTSEELNADFDRLSESVLRVKHERDALLEAAKTALFCAELEIKLNNKPWEGPAKQLREAIALAESE